MFRPMKPETIARRAERRRVAQATRRADLTDRMRKMAEEHGPQSIWAEMLVERLADDAQHGGQS